MPRPPRRDRGEWRGVVSFCGVRYRGGHMKRRTWIIIGIVLGLPLLLAGILGAGALVLALAEDLPVTEADKERIVDANEIAEYFDGFEPASQYEHYERTRYLDSSEELIYEYESPVADEPYIRLSISYEVSAGDARIVYDLAWGLMVLGLNLEDDEFDVEERPEYYSGGDRSRFGVIIYDEKEVGNLLVVQNGNTVLDFVISGFVIDDSEVWTELFDELIGTLDD